jgi:hypothetical protein
VVLGKRLVPARSPQLSKRSSTTLSLKVNFWRTRRCGDTTYYTHTERQNSDSPRQILSVSGPSISHTLVLIDTFVQ